MKHKNPFIALLYFFGVGVFITVPVFFVSAVDQTLTVQTLLQQIAVQLLNPIIVFLFILATLIFIWGVVLYVIGGQGDGAKMEVAKKILLWGLIGMFVMSSAWGIVNLMCNFFDTCNSQIPLSGGGGGNGAASGGGNGAASGGTAACSGQCRDAQSNIVNCSSANVCVDACGDIVCTGPPPPSPPPPGTVPQGGVCTATFECRNGLDCVLGFCNVLGPPPPPGPPPT